MVDRVGRYVEDLRIREKFGLKVNTHASLTF
jgi:hypothetical protein